ncbi:transposase [Wolbachia endosymbiont (group A) of Barypeithes pellucidus]|uniref:transposase n=1 Tax=Wolbachia endosymbiont (group A) of Barypeithes pellucidus TaxID=3139322 RepID=UPI003CCB3E40
MSNGREYTAELKEEAVKLFKERGETISKVAKDLGSVDKKYEKREKDGSLA